MTSRSHTIGNSHMMKGASQSGKRSVLGFYYPGELMKVDEMDRCWVLGNFMECRYGIEIGCLNSGAMKRFKNAEAAFQALKFWGHADEFTGLTGAQAFTLKRNLEQLRVQPDFTYGGWGSNWNAMLQVLRAKFTQNPDLAAHLLATGDAILLEHNSVTGRDRVWSNNNDGEGTNWLGAALMLIRDELAYTSYHTRIIAQNTWRVNEGPTSPAWQIIVRSATQEIVRRLTCFLAASSVGSHAHPPSVGSHARQQLVGSHAHPPSVGSHARQSSVGSHVRSPLVGSRTRASSSSSYVRPPTRSAGGKCICEQLGCNQPTWDGKPGYCSHTCRAQCARPGCNQKTWDGKPGGFCSRTCRDTP